MSEFWERKMRTYFHTFDYDKDGFISESDFAEMARNFAEVQNADPAKKENLIKVFVDTWRSLMKSADRKKDDRLTTPIFIESVRQQLYDPGLIIPFVHLIRGLFELMDVSADGYLQPEEHHQWFTNLGVPEERFDRNQAFKAMDVNGDGKLSIQEFVSSFFDFMFSNDESSPNKFYFGPLVD